MNAVVAWARRPAVLKVGKAAGYVAFGVVAFLVSVVLTFPSGRLAAYLEGRLSAAGRIVTIESASLTGLGSVSLSGLRVELPPEPAGGHPAEAQAAPPQKRSLSVERLDVSVGLFRLVFGDVSVDLVARSGGGVLGPVSVLKTKESVSVDVKDITDFPIPEMPLFGVRVSGVLSGKGTLTYNLKDGLAASTGRVELAGTRVRAVKPALRSEQYGSVSLTDVDLGKLNLVVNLDKRSNLPAFKSERRAPGGDATVVQFEKAEIDGTDVKALIEEHSVIRTFNGKPLGEGQLNVEAAFSLSDPFFDRSVSVGGEAQTPNRFLRTLLGMDPRWKAAQSGGYWGVVCTGTLSRPSCIPKKPSIRGGDFKAPAKEEDRGGTDKAEPAKAGRPESPRVMPGAPSVPSVPAPAVPVTPPPRAQPPSPPPEEPAPAPAAEPAPRAEPPSIAPPSVMGGVKPMVPTVIGRPRIRPPAGVEEGGDQPAPSPGGEGEGTVAPPGEGQE